MLARRGNDLMCTFMAYLKSSGEGAAEKEDLRKELQVGWGAGPSVQEY